MGTGPVAALLGTAEAAADKDCWTGVSSPEAETPCECDRAVLQR